MENQTAKTGLVITESFAKQTPRPLDCDSDILATQPHCLQHLGASHPFTPHPVKPGCSLLSQAPTYLPPPLSQGKHLLSFTNKNYYNLPAIFQLGVDK